MASSGFISTSNGALAHSPFELTTRGSAHFPVSSFMLCKSNVSQLLSAYPTNYYLRF